MVQIVVYPDLPFTVCYQSLINSYSVHNYFLNPYPACNPFIPTMHLHSPPDPVIIQCTSSHPQENTVKLRCVALMQFSLVIHSSLPSFHLLPRLVSHPLFYRTTNTPSTALVCLVKFQSNRAIFSTEMFKSPLSPQNQVVRCR